MKSKKQKFKQNNIHIISTEKTDRTSFWEIIISVLFIGLFTAETVSPVISLINILATSAVAIMIIVIMKILEKHIKKIWIVSVSFTAALSIAAFVFKKIFINGSIIYLNGIISNWNLKTGNIAYLFVTESANESLSILFFLCVIVMFISLWTESIIYYGKHMLLIIWNFIMFTLFTLITSNIPIWAVIWMSINMVIYIATDDAEVNMLAKRASYYVIIAITVIIVSVGILAGIRLIPAENAQVWHKSFVKHVEENVFGKSDLTDGDITKIQAKPDSKQLRLLIVGAKGKDTYLRGFVGSVYDGKSWTDSSARAYRGENLNMHQWLIDKGVSPLTMLAISLGFVETYNPDSFEVRYGKYNITNKGASKKYLYLPYGIGNITFKYFDNINKDLNFENSIAYQKNKYQVDTVELPVADYEKLYNNGALTDSVIIANNQDYFTADQVYRDYANTYYTNIPKKLKKYFDKCFDGIEITGAQNILNYIRAFLAEKIKYTTTPKNTYTEGNDFIINLLENDAEGYSVQYATVGTELFRYFGIPARYVEGYIKNADSDEVYANDAHAWVEIYRYGFGWVPVEVTPGYYESINQMVTGVMSEQNNTADAKTSLQEEYQGKKTENGNRLKLSTNEIIGLVIALILLVILFFVFRRLIILKIQKEKMAENKGINAVKYADMLIKKTALFKKLEISDDFSRNISYEMNKKFENITGYDFNEIVDIVRHAHYSKEGATAYDIANVKEYLKLMSNSIYSRAKGLKKIKLKYIDVLV